MLYSLLTFSFFFIIEAIFLPQKMDNEWDDQDAPPDLVDVGSGLEAEEKPARVPITIVTGIYKCVSHRATLG